MRISRSVLVTSVAFALVIGFAAGVAVYSWLDREQQTQFHTLTAPSADTTTSSDVSQPIAREKHPDDLDPILRVQSVPDSMKFASDFDQSASLYVLLARADVSDLERYINESISISSQNQRVAALSIIFGRYAAIDPRKALDRVLTLVEVKSQEKSNLVRAIFNEWTLRDRDAAIAAIESLPEQFRFSAASAMMWRSDFLSADQRIQLAEQIGPNDTWIANTVATIRSEASKVDPRQSFYEHVRDPTQSQERNIELHTILLNWIELEGAAILSEVQESLDNPNIRKPVLSSLIWNAISTKLVTPASVLAVVSEFPNKQDAKQAIENVFRSWSYLNPQESFQASLEFGDQLITHEFRSSLLQSWAAKDADGLLTEASSLPHEYRNTAVIRALGQMSRSAPEAAIQSARNLDARGLRIQARDEIIREWSSVDAKSAFEWLMNDGFKTDAEPEYSIWWRAFSSYLDQDFDKAQRYAEVYQGELKAKDRLIEGVARYLVESDPDRAIEYLPKVRRVSQRLKLRFSIGLEMAETRPIEALEFGATIEELQDQYYERLLGRWANRDFFALHANIQRVPNAYQGHAARYLLRINKTENYLNARDIRVLEAIVVSAPPIVPRGE